MEDFSAHMSRLVTDACGGRDQDAMQRTLAGLAFAGDAILTDVATISGLLTRPTA